jgi:ABC-type transport system involved in multi-copper enzyme maturation permease subunit
MIWVSWRQYRSQAIGCLAVLIALAVYAVIESSSMRTAFSHDDLAGCLARSQGTGCPGGVMAFMNEFGSEVNIAFWSVALIVPGLIGVLVGAPLIARELEYGTWRLAWSQTVPRTRWLAIKLALVTGGLIVLGAAITAVITWYRAPMDRLTGHLQHNIFDFEGLVPTAYILCAFGFAVLAGLLIRRSIPAMIAAFIPWLTIRLVVEFVFRPHFMTPLTIQVICPPTNACSTGISSVPQATGHIGDWVLGMNRTGFIYQPADRFWPFQFIEAGIFVGLTAAALGATIWLLHRRAAWTSLLMPNGRRACSPHPSPPSRQVGSTVNMPPALRNACHDARDRGGGPGQEVREDNGGGRRRSGRPARHGAGPAGPERRGEDHRGPDAGHAAAARCRSRPGLRRGHRQAGRPGP